MKVDLVVPVNKKAIWLVPIVKGITHNDCYEVLTHIDRGELRQKFQELNDATVFASIDSELLASKFFELGYAAAHIGYINEQNQTENSLGARTSSGRSEETEKPNSVLEKKSKEPGKKGTLF